MFKPKYFEIYELLPPYFYEENKDRGDALWYMFDNRLLITLDELRKTFGKMYINNWYWGGNRQYSGWRPFDYKGAFLSQHKFGRAADIIFEEHKAENVRNWIIENHSFQHITGMELDVPWLHIDVRNYNGLFLFNK